MDVRPGSVCWTASMVTLTSGFPSSPSNWQRPKRGNTPRSICNLSCMTRTTLNSVACSPRCPLETLPARPNCERPSITGINTTTWERCRFRRTGRPCASRRGRTVYYIAGRDGQDHLIAKTTTGDQPIGFYGTRMMLHTGDPSGISQMLVRSVEIRAEQRLPTQRTDPFGAPAQRQPQESLPSRLFKSLRQSFP